MKKQLIYHTYVNTNPSNKIAVCVETDSTQTNCYLDRVSRDGLSLSCDTETLHKIMPNKASIAPKDPIVLSVLFTISNNIEAKCRVILARRLSKNQFIMDLKFTEINESAMLHLNNYIEENLRSELTKKPSNQEQHNTKPQLLTSDIYRINKNQKVRYSKVA
tara:strand:+ start:283 stop:768 length:486 start_codon:yes stop_codon:yes gene_type:complete